ncbi:MAG: hypothetical protein ACRDPD_20220 [Streptosporangiaceae bacterium]
MDVMPAASAPRVLRFLQEPGRDGEGGQSLDSVLEEQTAALVGATRAR